MKTDQLTGLDALLPLQDAVFNSIRKAIINGELKPGERLMEVPLSEKLGVSRTPVRDAIHRLELEGLVVTNPRRGAVVAQITEKSLTDVMEVRRSLDELTMELACERITKEQLLELKNASKEFEALSAEADTQLLARADIAFHNIIIEAAGNMRLKQLVDNLAEQMYRYRFVYLKDKTIHGNLVKEHEAMYEALLSKDKDRARNAARVHIDNQECSIIDHIRNEIDKES